MDEKMLQTINYLHKLKRRQNESMQESITRLKTQKTTAKMTWEEQQNIGRVVARGVRGKLKMLRRMQLAAYPEKVYSEYHKILRGI